MRNTSATVSPFAAGEQHTLYIEAVENTGLRSLGILRMTAVVPTLKADLLIVDDTRLAVDRFVGDALQPPQGEWPTAAELDSFLYARGGVPWRGYPEGTLSSRGLFDGYTFDTLGTRGIPDGIVPFETLARYRHVIWLTDPVGATFNGIPTDPFAPTTSLKLMSSPGQQNTLAMYVAAGGKLWLAGGGAALASLIPWNARGTSPFVYSNVDGELVPGRLMYDAAHWRSEVTIGFPALQANKLVADAQFPFQDPSTAPGRGWRGQPDYALLPNFLQRRMPATDPLPPLRDLGAFYLSSYPTEFLSLPNSIIERRRRGHPALEPAGLVEQQDPMGRRGPRQQSALDTLYLATGGAVFKKPVMTYYHGSENPPMVFSGFPIWFFQRPQCQALVDFVLQQIWRLPPPSRPQPIASRIVRAEEPASGARVAPARPNRPSPAGRR